jgi:hypothetical protein
LLWLSTFVCHSCSSLDRLSTWHFTLLRSKLEYTGFGMLLTSDDVSKLEGPQRKFATLLFSYFLHVSYTCSCANAAPYLKLQTLRQKRRLVDSSIFFVIFTLVSNFVFPSLILLGFELLLGISDSFLCLILPVYAKTFLGHCINTGFLLI